MPPVQLILTGGLWFIVLVMWASGAMHTAGSVVFFLGGAAALAHVVVCALGVAARKPRLQAARAAVVLFTLAVVPVAFDVNTADVFNLTKYTIVIVFAVVILGLYAVELAWSGPPSHWRNPLLIPLIAVVGWTGVSTALGINPRVSLLGTYKSYDGLFSVVAFAVILFAAAEALSAADLRSVCSAGFFGGGGPVILYGVLQLHDKYLSGTHWDFVQWGKSPFGNKGISATFGNPNHLAGMIAIILPLGVGLILTTRHIGTRLLIATMSLTALAELLVASSRGAEAALPVAAIVMALVLAPEISATVARLRLPRLVLVAGGTVVVAAGVTFMKVARFFQAGPGSTIDERFKLWRIALRIFTHRPIMGTGPDTFRIRFPQAQTAGFVRLYGSTDIAKGPHSWIFNRLATQGIVGLTVFVWLLVAIGAVVVAAYRRLRTDEASGERRAAGSARTTRVLLGALAGALAAFVVEDAFNLEQVGLSMYFWVLAGVLAGVASGPRSSAPLDVPTARRRRRRGARDSHVGAATAAGLTAAAVGLTMLWPMTAPFRADGHYRVGFALDRAKHYAAAADSYQRASTTNQWEGSYVQSLGGALYEGVLTSQPGDQTALSDLRRSFVAYRDALSLDGTNTAILDGYAESLVRYAELSPRDAAGYLDQAVGVLRVAQTYDRYQPFTPVDLTIALGEQHKLPEALATANAGLVFNPTNPALLRWAARIEENVGDRDKAIQRWRQLLQAVKGDQEASKALTRLGVAPA